MGIRREAAPPTPWSQDLAEPTIDPTAYVHAFSQLIGDVRIGENVLVAPGVSMRADEGAPFRLGKDTNVQDGVVLHGLEHGKVLGDDQQPYSIWVGEQVCLTHKALIHGPAYIGNGCFVGFRSTIFNARLGEGVIVMMHALVQDVEIPPGKFVPSGAVVTRQGQADALPNVEPEDMAFVQDVIDANEALRMGYACAENTACITPIRNAGARLNSAAKSYDNGLNHMQTQRLTPDIVQQVRQLLSQGYRIGTEHTDPRRYRINIWQTCAPIQSTRESDVFAALENCIAEHAEEYVRMFGIDPVAKRRIAATVIQRPDGKPISVSKTASAAASGPSSSYGAPAMNGSGSLAGDLTQQIRQLLNQGYRIGTEYADPRRFKINIWQTCSPVQSTREVEVLAAVQACMAEHSGDYVRLIGIDPVAKRRVSEITIQRPDGRPVSIGSHSAPASAYGNNGSSAGTASAPVNQQVRQLLAQGYRVGLEYADTRRFRSNVWQTATVDASHEAGIVAAIDNCLQSHGNDYVRIFGIDPKAKTRMAPIMIQRPGQTAEVANGATSAPGSAPSNNGHGAHHNGSTAPGPLADDLVQQVRQLVNQGYRISVEHADVRRYRSGAWQSGGMIEGRGPSEVLAALEASLHGHSGEYVRIVGIDPKVKRRVLETTIQKP